MGGLTLNPDTVTPDPQIFVNGEFVQPRGSATYENVDPATAAGVGMAADSEPADMDATIDAARQAFDREDWSHDPSLRRPALEQLHQVFTERKDEWRRIFVLEKQRAVLASQRLLLRRRDRHHPVLGSDGNRLSVRAAPSRLRHGIQGQRAHRDARAGGRSKSCNLP
ncbi:aldehyde dehydrogenase family protein [Nocardia fusca]|uniref:aldehyde dehydrogenase family protein n=1 Tax=Nocardia fusca TaxID=941183 RepID=UPI0037BBE5F3